MCGKIWLENGALEYRECVGDDLKISMGIPFPKMIKIKPKETVIFSRITYKSRSHRNGVNSRVMKDLRMKNMDTKSMPFDPKRVVYGGFKIVVMHHSFYIHNLNHSTNIVSLLQTGIFVISDMTYYLCY
jgi:uncharacterized protein YbaA (DUF1428 family)